MDFMTNIDMKKLDPPIQYGDKLLLIGSCFTEHIGNTLGDLKFSVLQNPHGILFDPDSVCRSLNAYIDNNNYKSDELFLLNDVWHSWDHHSRFSNTNADTAIRNMNASVTQANQFLQKADWLIITLGSSFSYRVTSAAENGNAVEGRAVANCHRAPAQWFRKHLMEISETEKMLRETISRLKTFNPDLRIIFTVSPVRHLRDGVVENNRSKARLIEAVHQLVHSNDHLYYFPAYELVIDVLRDYRFYDIDLAHPNYMATDFVLEKFTRFCIAESSQELMQEIKKIVIARKHRPMQPDTKAHRQFLDDNLERSKTLSVKYPFLDFSDEINYFKS